MGGNGPSLLIIELIKVLIFMLKTAFVFPGQGSQSIGMLADLASHHSLIIETFAEASAVVGYDIWSLVQRGPEEQLNQTQYTQVAMLTADVAVYRVLTKQLPLQVMMMAGHSLGEYAALVASNALTLADAVKLVSRRGQLMQQTIPLGHGAMAAIIGLDNKQVESLCLHVSDENNLVTAANYNAPGQVVVAGHTLAVDKLIKQAEEAGARMAKRIPVSVPCHCPLLREAASLFVSDLERTSFNIPQLPVISNVNLSHYTSIEDLKTLLKEQLYQPVQWVETILAMKHAGVEVVIECGPGKVLTGLTKRIDKSLHAIHVNDNVSLASLIELFNKKGNNV